MLYYIFLVNPINLKASHLKSSELLQLYITVYKYVHNYHNYGPTIIIIIIPSRVSSLLPLLIYLHLGQ